MKLNQRKLRRGVLVSLVIVTGFLVLGVWAVRIGALAQNDNESFPPAGTDTFPTSIMFVDQDEDGGPVLLGAQGPTIVERSDPLPTPTGRVIETEIVSMELTGVSPLGPVSIRAGRSFGLPPSTGRTFGSSPGSDFPAESFFDVFYEIEIGGAQLCNTQPQQVSATITEIPPVNPLEFSFSSILDEIQLEDCGGDKGELLPANGVSQLVASLMAFHCTPQMAGLPPNTLECCLSAVNTYNNGGCCPPGPPPANSPGSGSGSREGSATCGGKLRNCEGVRSEPWRDATQGGRSGATARWGVRYAAALLSAYLARVEQ